MSQRYVIRCVMWAREELDCPYAGAYLEWYNPNGPWNKPLASWTRNVGKAKRFKTAGAGFREWQLVRTNTKDDPEWFARTDGKPQRPLTAFTVSIEPVKFSKKKGGWYAVLDTEARPTVKTD